MTWGAIGAAAVGGTIGVLTKDSGGQTQQSTQNQISPVNNGLLYGSNGIGGGGLLGNAYNNFLLQNQVAGTNPLMNAGLESQRQVLSNPGTTTGFDQMRGLGSSLLSGGVAGNPFTQGHTAGASQGTQGASYTPQQSYQSFGFQNNPTLDWQNSPIQQVSNPIQNPQAAPAQQGQQAASQMDPNAINNMIAQFLAQQNATAGGTGG